MKRPRATAPRPAEIHPTVLMRVVSSSPSSSFPLRWLRGNGMVPVTDASSPLVSVGVSALRDVERNFIILDDSSGVFEFGETVVLIRCSFCVIGSLTRNIRKGLI